MAPKAEKKPAKKVAKSTSSAAAKKRKLAKAETYKIYIYKVLKQARACWSGQSFVTSHARLLAACSGCLLCLSTLRTLCLAVPLCFVQLSLPCYIRRHGADSCAAIPGVSTLLSSD